MKKKYRFIEDPGHGWLEVDRAEIKRLGVEAQISAWSYIKGDKAYLEEDCDAGVFLRAKTEAGEEFELVEVYQDPTPVRNYRSWGQA